MDTGERHPGNWLFSYCWPQLACVELTAMASFVCFGPAVASSGPSLPVKRKQRAPSEFNPLTIHVVVNVVAVTGGLPKLS